MKKLPRCNKKFISSSYESEVSFGLYSTEGHNIPLKDIKFQVDIKDCLSMVETTQLYINLNEDAVECEYLFPIDSHTTAITSLKIIIDGTVVEAKLSEREKAEEKYVDAIAKGNTAFKMDQDEMQPDIIRMIIGQLLPNKEVIIVVKYIKLLEVENGHWSFKIPLTYTPRYGSNTKQEFIKGIELPYKCHLNMLIETSKPITKIVSPSHEIEVKYEDLNRTALVSLENVIPESDLIVLYRTENFRMPSVFVQESFDNDCYAALINFYPYFDGVEEFAYLDDEIGLEGSGEYIFLLDCSGSMDGIRIELAKSALEMFLRSLPVGSKFNIVCFGTSYKFFEKKSVNYTTETLALALKFIKVTTANMGGTIILQALSAILAIPCEPFYPRSIFMLTDGAVSNPNQVIWLIKKSAYNTRVHTFGIGSGASQYLVKGLAIAGKGSFQFATEGEDLTPKIITSLKRATLPAYTDVKIEWPPHIKVLLQSPSNGRMPNFYMNEPFVILAIYESSSYGEKVTLQLKETATQEELSYDVTLPEDIPNGNDIHKATVASAFETNIDLKKEDIIDLSLKYSVLSKETAFIAVQKNKGKVKSAIGVIRVPQADTKDSSQIYYTKTGKHGRAKAIPIELSHCLGGLQTKSTMLECAELHNEEDKRVDLKKAPKEYEEIVKQQTLYGYWDWTSTIFDTIKVIEQTAHDNIPSKLKSTISDEKKLLTAWITILVLNKLESDCKESKESWILIFRKALQWLRKTGIKYEEFKDSASQIIR